MGLTVAITGPTGDIGRALLRQVDSSPEVDRVIGMARRPFNPADLGLEKTEYLQGDILDEDSLAGLVEGTDVLVHLAFIILGGREETQRINLEGTRNVFQAATSAGLRRFIYTSSVAAYGFHEDNPQPLTEDVAPKGTDEFYYSAQKAELERELHRMVDGSEVDAYVFRPCIVAGHDALTLITAMLEQLQLGGRLPQLTDFLKSLPYVSPSCLTRARRSSSCTTTTSRRRWWQRSRVVASPASTTSRETARSQSLTSPRRSAGTRCRCRPRPWR
jgi:UDP-glucose 4-epimerase